MGIHIFSQKFKFSLCATIELLLFCSVLGGNNETDRLALLEFKSKISDPLGVLSSWNSSFHFCQWYGIKCEEHQQRVTVLHLSSQRLEGSISPHLGNITFLQELSLRNNRLSGEIPPQIGNLNNATNT
ncbi:hypothetical protein L6164_020940 [Bauhinia variegata]|uniref:Uncharacterized protein n=1 Tax=Bauhinia variegata TaxID=167791 RepID=A0ACB9MY56_BAUVA|nr:hypothetical protein L6164_020940 [Bauhinia variegata]